MAQTAEQVKKLADEMREQAKRLPGKTIKLAPPESMFVEEHQHYVLNAYTENAGAVTFEEGWKAYPTLLNVRAGILRVYDGDKDVSVDFGGPERLPERHGKSPIVAIARRFDAADKLDAQLKKVLMLNDERKILTIIGSGYTMAQLERMLILEKRGENCAFKPRQTIVEKLESLMKNIVLPPSLGDESHVAHDMGEHETITVK